MADEIAASEAVSCEAVEGVDEATVRFLGSQNVISGSEFTEDAFECGSVSGRGRGEGEGESDGQPPTDRSPDGEGHENLANDCG
jgi:hypothetical protein